MRKFSHVFSFYFREAFLSKKSLITSAILFLVVFGILHLIILLQAMIKIRIKIKLQL